MFSYTLAWGRKQAEGNIFCSGMTSGDDSSHPEGRRDTACLLKQCQSSSDCDANQATDPGIIIGKRWTISLSLCPPFLIAGFIS